MVQLMNTLSVYKFHKGKYVLQKRDFPWMRGIIFTTKSILELQYVLLTEHDYKSVFLGHFTQDSVEHLFSMIRSKIPDPTPRQSMSCLKKITIGRYIEEVPRASYEFTNGLFLIDSLDAYTNKKIIPSYKLEILALSTYHDVPLLVYIYGACIFSILKVHLNNCACKKLLT
jgi:hypothetical protein